MPPVPPMPSDAASEKLVLAVLAFLIVTCLPFLGGGLILMSDLWRRSREGRP